MLINDWNDDSLKESDCPNCWRKLCVQCNVPWHTDISCEEYEKLDVNERETEDIMLKKIAEKEHWMRCRQCGFYVQKIDGCCFVKCR